MGVGSSVASQLAETQDLRSDCHEAFIVLMILIG